MLFRATRHADILPGKGLEELLVVPQCENQHARKTLSAPVYPVTNGMVWYRSRVLQVLTILLLSVSAATRSLVAIGFALSIMVHMWPTRVSRISPISIPSTSCDPRLRFHCALTVPI